MALRITAFAKNLSDLLADFCKNIFKIWSGNKIASKISWVLFLILIAAAIAEMIYLLMRFAAVMQKPTNPFFSFLLE